MLSELLQPTAYSLATQIYSTYTNIVIVTFHTKLLNAEYFATIYMWSSPLKSLWRRLLTMRVVTRPRWKIELNWKLYPPPLPGSWVWRGLIRLRIELWEDQGWIVEVKIELNWEFLPGPQTWRPHNGRRTAPLYWVDYDTLARTSPPPTQTPHRPLPGTPPTFSPFNKNYHCPLCPACRNDCKPLKAVLSSQGLRQLTSKCTHEGGKVKSRVFGIN